MSYVYMLAGDDRDRELALAESAALADAIPCSAKLVRADRLVDIARTGYLTRGIELLASGADADEVAARVAALDLAADAFAVEVVRIPRGLATGRRELAARLALVIGGRPDLARPRERFLAFVTPDGVWFGRSIDAAEPDWRRFVRKPCDFSSALPAQPARAIADLLVRGGEHVVDPCCGSGTLLLHAAALGAAVRGFDISPKMVWSARKNLRHFGVEPDVSQADAAELTGRFGVVLTNLPYGNMSPVTREKLEAMVPNIVRLAPRGAFVTTDPIGGWIEAAGAEVEQVIPLAKFSFLRHVFLYRSRG